MRGTSAGTGRNKEFRRTGVGWQYQGTVEVILIIWSEVDLRGFGKRGQKAVTERAHVRFPTKKGKRRDTPSPPTSPIIEPLHLAKLA